MALMTHDRGRVIRGALLAAVAGTFAFSGVAAAQTGAASTPGADLRRQLGELAANPTSVSELIETGRAALAVGDGEAALGFFTRASQLAPQDGRVKAGLAAAHTRTGRPETALVLFTEALAAGAPAAEVAAERGLAYDLLGQPARAQQDYLASLKQREDPEVRRRLALSLAISGQREAALRLLDPQVRLGDRAAGRARIMVMALSGDVGGATAAATSSLAPAAAQAIAPFLSRLASLSPGQMAAAANLGRLPSGSVRSAGASRGAAAADPNALAFAGGGSVAALSSRLPVAPATGASEGVRRRPGGINSAARSTASPGTSPGTSGTARTLASARTPAAGLRDAGRPSESSWTAPATASAARSAASAASVAATVSEAWIQPHPYEPLKLPARAEAAPTAAAADVEEPVELAGASGGPRLPEAELKTEEPVLAGGAGSRPVQIAQVEFGSAQPAAAAQQQPQQEEAQPAVVDGAAANLAVWNSGAAPTLKPVPNSNAAPTRLSAPRPGFSDVVATVSSLPAESSREAAPAASRPAARSAVTTARSTPASTARSTRATSRTAAATTRPAAPARATGAAAHPSRIWVQLGVSANRAGFNYEISRMRRAAPELFKNRTAHVAPIGSSHRLLVGPFPDAGAARAFINGLKQKDIAALSWTSPAGTQVERFAAGR